MTAWRLYINGKFTGVTLRPDSQYPSMWRIHADGRVSDMINLSRAKDAALTWVRRDGLGRREDAEWRYAKTPLAASYARQTEVAA